MFRYFANQSEYTDLKNSGKRIDLNGVAVKTPMHCPPGGKEKPHFMVISLSGDKWKFQTADMVGAKAWEQSIQNNAVKFNDAHTGLSAPQSAHLALPPTAARADRCSGVKHAYFWVLIIVTLFLAPLLKFCEMQASILACIAFSPSFDVLSSIKRKVEKYRRGTEVPCIFVAVSGLNGQDTIASTAAAAVAVGPLAGVGSGAGSALQTAPVPAVSEFEADINAFNRANPALFQANPITGNGVSIVFEKLVHQVFEKVVPRTRRSKVGKSNRKSRLFSSKAEVRRSTALRCTALHGCCLAETETRGH